VTVGQCSGNGNDHCCSLGATVCPFLVESTAGRRWACGLRVELGSWAAVHNDERYVTVVRPQWDKVGIVDCGDWPEPGESCAVCGVVGGES
jgi:hypothetical protein